MNAGKLSENYIVKKSNIINELIESKFTLQELRLFSVYLSRINPEDISSRVVRFKINDFQRLTGLKHLWKSELKRTFRQLLSKSIVELSDDLTEGGGFQIFSEINPCKDENGDKCIEIIPHYRALPYLFNLKREFFRYKLWNVLQLKSANQFRMYEILKQYENKGSREISVFDLKEQLGIAAEAYPRIDNFRQRVIDKCKIALKEHTDITFEYRLGKAGAGGKWETIIFDIYKNTPTKKMLDFENKLKEDINIEAAAAELTPADDLRGESPEQTPAGTTAGQLRALEAVQDLPPEPESQGADDIREQLLKAAEQAQQILNGGNSADELPEKTIQLDNIAYDMFATAGESLTETEILEIKCTLQCKGYEADEIFINFKRIYYRALNKCNDPAKLKEYIIKCIESEKRAS